MYEDVHNVSLFLYFEVYFFIEVQFYQFFIGSILSRKTSLHESSTTMFCIHKQAFTHTPCMLNACATVC